MLGPRTVFLLAQRSAPRIEPAACISHDCLFFSRTTLRSAVASSWSTRRQTFTSFELTFTKPVTCPTRTVAARATPMSKSTLYTRVDAVLSSKTTPVRHLIRSAGYCPRFGSRVAGKVICLPFALLDLSFLSDRTRQQTITIDNVAVTGSLAQNADVYPRVVCEV